MSEPIIQCQGISKTFNTGKHQVEIFKNFDLTVSKGEQLAILGSSGSGKSTLLHLLGGLDRPSSGEINVCGKTINTLSENALAELRNQKLGFVYQFHHLLPEFNALENACMPLLLRGYAPKIAQDQARVLLEKVGLQNRHDHKVGELSGGERQRVAIVRALITKPEVVLADEPTGNLDPQTAETVYEVMLELNRSLQTTLVIVTHNPELAHKMDRQLQIGE